MRTPPPLMRAVFGSFSHGAVVARHRVGRMRPLPLILPLLPNTPAESEFNNVLWKLNSPSHRAHTSDSHLRSTIQSHLFKGDCYG